MPLGHWLFNETSPAAAGTAASSQPVQNAASFLPSGVAGPLDDYLEVRAVARLVGATGGTLDVYLQFSPDAGQSWDDLAHFAQLAAAAPAATYTLTTSMRPSTITTIGTGLSPALAANTVAGGPWGDRIRLVMVAGAGTSAGANVLVTLLAQRHRVVQ